DSDMGAREIALAVGCDRTLLDQLVQPLLGQDQHVGALAIAQALQQPQRRREIRIDPRAGRRTIWLSQLNDRALEGVGRQHTNGLFHDGLTRLNERLTTAQMNDPPEAFASSGPSCNPLPRGLVVFKLRGRLYAAALAPVGTEEIVFRICEAIWYGSPCEFGRRSSR